MNIVFVCPLYLTLEVLFLYNQLYIAVSE